MESIYPNFVPEEGFLPLSKGQLTPTGEPALNAPSCEPGAVPNGVTIPPMETLPDPRKSPTSERPTNNRVTNEESTGAVKPVSYLAPPLKLHE
jgi:hypothetical protein